MAFSKIIVPLDFSPFSKRALEVGQELAQGVAPTVGIGQGFVTGLHWSQRFIYRLVMCIAILVVFASTICISITNN